MKPIVWAVETTVDVAVFSSLQILLSRAIISALSWVTLLFWATALW